jgi:hypothetical protein
MKILIISALILSLAGSVVLFSQEIVINEFQASNGSSIADPDFGLYTDWIELYNTSDQTIDLGGWYLTDNLEDTVKWSFPGGVSLDPGAYLVIWADEEDVSLTALHSSFKLSITGEAIGLFDDTKILVDSLVFGKQSEDISMGRQPDGGATWHFFNIPTPGTSNITAAYLKARVPEFSLQSGFYTEDQPLAITSGEPGTTIRYTLNGDEPDDSSPVYDDLLLLKSRIGEANLFSEIRTTLDPHHWLPDWVPPAGEVFKANVVRARAFKTGYEASDIITLTCYIDADMQQRYGSLPVISIVSDRKHLFDYQTGIYVPGATHRAGDEGSGNYFQDWEKPAHISYFEPGGQLGFAQDVGMKIQGGTSPSSPQKGLHIIARSAYGTNRIKYPIFKDDPSKAKELTEFKRFIIRAWGSLISGSLLNDAYAHRLMANSELDIQAYQPAIVFINGEYWGLHALREANKNSWYYQFHYDIDREDPGVDILQHTLHNGQPYADVDEGDATHWNGMMNFLRSNDMKLPQNYAYLKTQMDMDNFIAYMWHCIYVGKWDWPNNNDASWRHKTVDGKWKWIQFDMETGFGVATSLGPQYSILGPQFNMIKTVVEGLYIPGFGKYGPHPIMAVIYENEEFTDAFVDWYEEHSSREFHPDTMNALLDEMAAEIRPYMTEYQHRWPFIGSVREDWETSLELIKEYNRIRPTYVEQHLWSLSNTENLTPLEYKLLQNSPNPFSRNTVIKYQLPEPASIILRIYNSQGQLIASFEQKHPTGGTYALEWDAWSLAAGVYIVTMETEGFFEVKKLVKIEGEK